MSRSRKSSFVSIFLIAGAGAMLAACGSTPEARSASSPATTFAAGDAFGRSMFERDVQLAAARIRAGDTRTASVPLD